MKYTLLITFCLLSILCSLSCSSDDDYFPEDRKYKHSLFSSDEECREAQSQYFMNCSQTVSFNKDGSATYMVTDIMMRAKYKVKGKKITLSIHKDDAYETNAVVYFKIEDENKIIKEDDGTEWELY
ncbi:hypothetical protein M2451_000953 [Dysgonomonas sp. PFB1-18]|uniref:hypothetical protein n=1 Tax=unclassified Dysgonomonas TaxID=2630389 RepID=UPI002475BC43|nr:MULTISPECIES: hypothetical protein [unclassified Dysgonomonas]MDH6308642.1 hypothetical protein [Dysgonomonas sp. PF1-14]MDH6338143.1 hypothetical protein [Dysgonomonas sp. PF1-16]MDH6379640.1 hypothetical protein [Dysgonomonas sp. PFB1-18]MDH6396970.1 hypothetical protein [Dysgonomonas sp. PF1-23]